MAEGAGGRDTGNERSTQILAARPAPKGTEAAGAIRRHKSGFVIALVVLLFAGAGLAYWFTAGRSSQVGQIESIAVLPFINESDNDEVEYISDGMTESLIISISQLPHLSVKARSSVFRYKGKEMALDNHRLRCCPCNPPDRARCNAAMIDLYLSLVDGRNGNQLWVSVTSQTVQT